MLTLLAIFDGMYNIRGLLSISKRLQVFNLFGETEACVIIGHTSGKSKDDRIQRFKEQGLGPNYLISKEARQRDVVSSLLHAAHMTLARGNKMLEGTSNMDWCFKMCETLMPTCRSASWELPPRMAAVTSL